MNALILTIIIAAVITLSLLIVVIMLSRRVSKLTKGKIVSNLESVIIENNKLALEIKQKLKDQEIQIVDIKKDAMNNVQNIGVVRFNPFKETGGSQSFAIALTDKNGTGVVLSSLFTRDRMNVFAKPVINGASEYNLTDEEQSAINQSRK